MREYRLLDNKTSTDIFYNIIKNTFMDIQSSQTVSCKFMRSTSAPTFRLYYKRFVARLNLLAILISSRCFSGKKFQVRIV